MDGKQSKKRKIWRAVFLGMALFGIVNALSCVLIPLLAPNLRGISFSVSQSSGIGVIGGADGPTAILVTASAVSVWELLFWILVVSIGVCGFLQIQKGKSE